MDQGTVVVVLTGNLGEEVVNATQDTTGTMALVVSHPIYILFMISFWDISVFSVGKEGVWNFLKEYIKKYWFLDVLKNREGVIQILKYFEI